MQQRFDGTRRWQVQENPVPVLFDLRGYLEECQDHGSGLGRGEGRVRERVRPEGMVQDVGTTGEEQPCGVREKGRGRRAVTVEVALDRLDIVFAIAPSAVEVLVHVLGCRVLQDVTTNRGSSPAAMTSALTMTRPRRSQEAAA